MALGAVGDLPVGEKPTTAGGVRGSERCCLILSLGDAAKDVARAAEQGFGGGPIGERYCIESPHRVVRVSCMLVDRVSRAVDVIGQEQVELVERVIAVIAAGLD